MKSTVTVQNTAFAYGGATLQTIKSGSENCKRYANSLEQVKENAFIYNFNGKVLTSHQRFSINHVLSGISTTLAICSKWHKVEDSWALYQTVGYVKPEDVALIYEAFKNTFFHKWQITDDIIGAHEVSDAMALWGWFCDIMFLVQQDYAAYVSKNN